MAPPREAPRPPDCGLALRLVRGQFPAWAGLPLAEASAAGTDNAVLRLGPELVLRLPRSASAARQLRRELRWLPRLAPRLPIAVPEPVAEGRPAHGYPWPFAVYRWIEGESAAEAPLDLLAGARDLGRFVAALGQVDLPGGPPTGPDQTRGRPLRVLDAEVRAALGRLAGVLDAPALLRRWEAAASLPPWSGPPRWLHADLHGANLIARDGRIAAVIDFGTLGVGDPACDLMPAWTVLTARARPAFRAAVAPSAETWERGRGWALAWALIAHAYYRERGHVLGPISGRTLAEVLADRD